MKRKIAGMLLLAGVTALLSGCVDQSGGSVQKNGEIVATSITVCEVLDALEVENVTGVPDSAAYEVPERYKDAALVGSAMTPDLEIIGQLQPEWVLSPASLEEDLASQYETININSAFLNLTSVTGLYRSVQELGELLGYEEQAEVLVNEFMDFMEDYSSRNEGKESPRILILMGLPGSYVVATEHSYAGSLVELAGGTNVYAGESEESFINVNAEDMVQKAPDMILLTSHALPDEVEAMFEEEFAENDIWQHFQAVQEDQVYTLDYHKFGMSANFLYQEALEELQELLYE